MQSNERNNNKRRKEGILSLIGLYLHALYMQLGSCRSNETSEEKANMQVHILYFYTLLDQRAYTNRHIVHFVIFYFLNLIVEIRKNLFQDHNVN